MNSEVLVRRAVAQDLPRVVEIAAESEGLPHWGEQGYRKLLEPDTALPLIRVLLVAEVYGNVQGFAVASVLLSLLPVEAEIEMIAVDRRTRRQGIGLALLTELLALLAAMCAATIRLEVRVSNAAATALYRRAGFREEGLRKGYYTAPVEDALMMAFAVGLR